MSTGMAMAKTAPKSKEAGAPKPSIMKPAADGPTAMPQVMPAFTHVMPSVSRSVGTARSTVALATMRNGA